MSLTPQEMAELEALRAEQGNNRSPGQVSEMNYSVGGMGGGNSQAPTQASSLTKEEEAELLALRQEQDQNQQSSLGDKAQTQLESFGNAVSFGYLPQIQAAFERLNPNPTGPTDEQLKAQGFKIEDPSYVQMRDENIQRQKDQEKRNPSDAIAGSLAGMATQTPIIAERAAAFGLGQVPGALNRIKDSFTTGFGLGAIMNPGDTQGQVNLFQGPERLKNAGTSGAIGTAGQVGGEAIAKTGSAIKNAPQTLDKLSKVKAFKAAGAMLKDFRNARGDRAAEEVGEVLINKGIVKAGDSIEEIAQKTSTAKNEAGQKIREIYKQVTGFINDYKDGVIEGRKFSAREQRILESTKLNGSKIAENIKTTLGKQQKSMMGATEVKGKMDEILTDITNLGDDANIADMLAARNSLDKRINYGKKMGELPLLQQQMSTARQEITKAIQNRVRAVGAVVKDKALIKTLRDSNKEFGQLSMVEDFATDRVARDNANRFFSLGDRVTSGTAGAIGALTGDTPEERVKNGLIGFVGGRLASKYGRHSTAMAAHAAKNLGIALKKPAAFAKFGAPLIEAAKNSPQEFQALLNQLGKDPEFIKLSSPAYAR